MALYFLRHGESTGNAQQIYQCQADYPLSELGRTQAQAVGSWLAAQGLHMDHAFASPLSRAFETAQIALAALGGPPPQADPRLMEYDGGSLTGLALAEFEARYPEFSTRGIEQWGDLSIYGGESLAQMEERLQAFRAEHLAVRDIERENILCVSHGGTLHHLIKLLCCYPAPRLMFTRLENCTLVRLDERMAGGQRLCQLRWVLPVELLGSL